MNVVDDHSNVVISKKLITFAETSTAVLGTAANANLL